MDARELKTIAAELRLEVLRMICHAGKGHIGGAFSCLDILASLYFGGSLKFDPQRPSWPERDRVVLSKGHAAQAIFATLARAGYFPKEALDGYCVDGSYLGGHPSHKLPGVEFDTGSLGHGLGVCAGIAMANRMDGRDSRVFAILGDGECYEGSVWEALLFAAGRRLGNLVAVVDHNHQTVLGKTDDYLSQEPFADKFKAFGWNAIVVDGHDVKALADLWASLPRRADAAPTAVICETVKGKGVSFMEGVLRFHHSVPSKDELAIAEKELLAQCEEALK